MWREPHESLDIAKIVASKQQAKPTNQRKRLELPILSSLHARKPSRQSLRPPKPDDAARGLPSYHYNTLRHNEIRLIDIKPAIDIEEPLECTTTTAFLDGRASPQCRYATLSYAWGETSTDGSHLTHIISCDGQALRITASLYHGLKRIRSSRILAPVVKASKGTRKWGFGRRHSSQDEHTGHTEREPRKPWYYLWVDGICINQADILERNAQVRIMADVYSSCSAFLVWLGEPRSVQDQAQLQQFFAIFRERGFNGDDEHLASCITDRAWFSRRWVIQEVELTQQLDSRYVLVGEHRIPYARLENASKQWRYREFQHPSEITGLFGPSTKNRPLLQNLLYHEKAQCANAHDRVFALVHISSDAVSFTSQIDYSKTVEEMYFAIAKSAIRMRGDRSQILSVLTIASSRHMAASVCDSEGDAGKRLPSWVPDWRLPRTFVSTEHEEAITYIEGNGLYVGQPLYEIIDRDLLLRGELIECCFPPRHAAHDYCRCCHYFADSWHWKTSALQNRLAVLQQTGRFCFLPDAYALSSVRKSVPYLIFVLDETLRPSSGHSASVYKLDFCFMHYGLQESQLEYVSTHGSTICIV